MDSYERAGRDAGYVEGATVKVLRKCKDQELGWGAYWTARMDAVIGKEFIIGTIIDADGLQHPEIGACFPWHVCELIAPPPETEIDYDKIPTDTLCYFWDGDERPAKPEIQNFAMHLPEADSPYVSFGNGRIRKNAKILIKWKHCEPAKPQTAEDLDQNSRCP